jgi:hypothetical protein
MYSYCYVCSVLGIPFHCVVLCIVYCVNVYCTTANRCQSNCSQQIYHIIIVVTVIIIIIMGFQSV